jgi:hypothetical protein
MFVMLSCIFFHCADELFVGQNKDKSTAVLSALNVMVKWTQLITSQLLCTEGLCKPLFVHSVVCDTGFTLFEHSNSLSEISRNTDFSLC